MRLARPLMLIALAVFIVSEGRAQTAYDGNQPLPPFGSFSGSDFDTVSLQNGNLHIRIPLGAWPQRGGKTLAADFIYDSLTWSMTTTVQTLNNIRQTTETVEPSGGGWQLSTNWGFWNVSSTRDVTTCPGTGVSEAVWHSWNVRDPQGTLHPLDLVTSGTGTGNCVVQVTSSPTLDGSGMFVDIGSNPPIIRLKDGSRIVLTGSSPLFSAASVEDPNGNLISTTDTLNRTLVSFTTNTTVSPANTEYFVTDSNGQQQTYKMTYGGAGAFTTDFCGGSKSTPSFVCKENSGLVNPLPGTLTLPNGQTYTFSWINGPSPEIQSITLPTGGTIGYTWGEICTTAPNPQGTTGNLLPQDCRAIVKSRTLTVNGLSSTWTYSGGTVTDPLGNDQVHVFAQVNNGSGGALSAGSYETQMNYYQGSSTSGGKLVKQVKTDYTCEDDPVSLFCVNVRPIRITTTLDNGLASKTETDYETFTFPEGNQSLTVTRMNVTEKREFDYGSGAPGALIRRTDYTYLHQSNSTYLNLNMVDRPATQITFDGSGNKVAETDNEYDNYTAGIQAGGAIRHDSALGTAYTTRGNITAVKHWRNTDNSFLTTRNQFDDAGNVISTTDPLGHATQFDYTDSWGNAACAPSGQAKAYRTKATNALNQIAKDVYNSCFGTLASTSDANNLTTSHSYEMLNRRIQSNFADLGQATACFSEVSGSTCFTGSLPVTITQTQKINPTHTKTSKTVLDGLGRAIQTQLTSDPQGTVFVDTTYDALGRVATVSNPHRSGTDPTSTAGITTYGYDAIGRKTSVTYPDGSVDGTSYSNNSTTVTDATGKQRRSVSDALGRLVEVDEPGLNAGTPASGSVTLSGTEGSKVTSAATSSSGGITISGQEKSFQNCNCPRCEKTCGFTTVFDTGTVTVTINGTQYKASYGSSDVGSTGFTSVAQAVVNALNSGSLVTASLGTSTSTSTIVKIKSIATGSAANYTLSVSSASSNGFSPPSFSGTASGSAMTGGADASSTFDSGILTVTINGTPYKATYGQNDSASTVATSVRNALNASGSLVQASINSSSPLVVNFTTVANGSAADYSLTVSSSSNNPSLFNPPSFAISASGSALTGGADPTLTLTSPAVTLYTYDALGNLTCAVQKGTDTSAFSTCAAAPATWRPRSFSYNSLSQVTSATNPESGTITYGYDDAGNLHTKLDARGITTTYGYDTLNRETSVSYSNGDPGITIRYDEPNCLGLSNCQNLGHRTSMTDAAGTESWAYQVDGANSRSIHADQRTINSSPNNITKTGKYFLDLAGNVTQAVYPTGRTVNYTYDAADRPTTAADASNGITYASDFQNAPTGCLSGAVCYTPQGTFYALSIGQSSGFTGLNLTHTYNNRLQPLEFTASSSGGKAIDISYGLIDPVTSKNAGHVYALTNNLDSTRSQNFTYDALNRLASAQTTSTHATSAAHCWGEAYNLDAWGNLQSIAPTGDSNYLGCSQDAGFSSAADAHNHLAAWSYDASGNASNDGVNGYTWDAESQLKSGAGVNYLYDGDGRRVAKAGSKLYWYGAGGEILAETDAAGNTAAEYIFFGGKRIAMIPSGGSPLYYVEDMLGTSRVITTSAGSVCYDADFYPYGGERSYTNTCPQNYKFEGKERDAETGNDDFGARYYSNRFGRWLSADWSSVPVPVPYANLINPQTLNLYAMVSDDPESFADLDGHGCDVNDENCAPQNFARDENTEKQAKLDGDNPPPGCNAGCAARIGSHEDKPQNPQTEAGIGIAKELVNTVTGAINLLGDASALLLGTGTPAKIPDLAPSNGLQKTAMATTSVLLFAIPGTGESKAPEAVKLAKSLASEAQVAGAAEKVIAGFGAKGGKVLRDAGRLSAEYGGKPGEWSKMSSGAYKAADGSVISTHWYQQVGSVIKYELKSIIDSAPWSKPF